jgi:hypothetical protein
MTILNKVIFSKIGYFFHFSFVIFHYAGKSILVYLYSIGYKDVVGLHVSKLVNILLEFFKVL